MFRSLLPLFLCAASLLASPRINEVQSTNTSFPDPFGQLIDWVEIHNASDSSINLQGHYLSDSTSNRLKFQFPSVTIAPRGYLLVWCGQTTDFPTNGTYPAGQLRAIGFGISSGGEPIVLSAPDGTTTLDEFPALVIGSNGTTPRSLGRGTDGNFNILYFYNTPTPNAANTTSGTPAETLQPPTFSVPGGMFTSNVTLALSTTLQNATIRYTTDGSDPTESSPIYSAPLALGPGGNNSTGYSWVPTNRQNFSYDESWQPPEGSVFRINVIRARAFKSGAAPSPIATHSYLIDPAGASRYPFPVLSINTDPIGLFSDATGIYVHGLGDLANYFKDGSDWERPGQIEFFETGGATAFRGNMGVRLHGNTSVSRPRKSLRIYSREVTGEPFNHRIFPEKEIEKFSTFLLRNSGNDWGQAMLRDAFLTSLATHTDLDIQSSRPAVVFLNGEYWGLHNLRDRIDEGYYLQHHGLGEMEFTQLDVHWQPVRPHWPVYDRGNPDPAMLQDFEDILNRANNNEYSSESSFTNIASRIDVENYIDYNAYQIFSGNGDWPANNTRLWRAVTPDLSPGSKKSRDGRWRWILFDTDMGLGLNFDYVPGWNSDSATHAQVNTLAYATAETSTSFADAPEGTLLLRKLTANPTFRAKFITRFADLLNTTMSINRTTSELTQIQSLYNPGIAEHKSRWRQPYDWSADMDRIRTFLQARPAAIRSHIIQKFGLPGTTSLTVDGNATQGAITVNTIALDPSTPGVAQNPFPWTGTYFQNIPVTVKATAKPGFRFVSWSQTTGANGTTIASDAASNYTNWENGSNAGNGFGPWSLNRSTDNSDNAGVFLDNGRDGWGLYANDGQTARISRSFDNALEVGQTFTARIRHGAVNESGDIGFELANNSGKSLFKLQQYWWSSNYQINGSSTSIPATTSPFDLQVTLVGNTTYSARITPVGGTTSTYNGTLSADSDVTVRRFLAFNYSAGSGSANDVFVTSMQISTPAAPGNGTTTVYSTNATIAPPLSASATFTANFELEPATTLVVEIPPAAIPGTALPFLRVKAVNSAGDTDGNYDAQSVTLTLTGPNAYSQTYQSTTTAGIAEFTGVILPATGTFSLSATSGSLATATPQTFSSSTSARFLPTITAPWNTAANWDIQAVPNNNLASATFTAPQNQTANRDTTLQAPVTIASVVFENGASTFRNRINGTTGNALTFASANGTSSITVTGTGTGHTNIEVAAGVVAQNDIVLDVQNTATTNAEYGALRLQGRWSGSGGFIKRGPGLAGITGDNKTFSGNITIEQGTLTFSEPAVLSNTASRYTVLPGGQLRLSSTGNPRQYRFSGPIHLAGTGRSGVPDNENLGVLGALRLETGATGGNIFIENSVVLTAAADIHVPALNTVTLNSTLLGNTTLSKSGGGTLVLPPSTSDFRGAVTVTRGILRLTANLTGNSATLDLASNSTLSGNGSWGGPLRLPSGATLASELTSTPLRATSAQIDAGALASFTTTNQTAPGLYPILTITGSATGLANITLASTPALHPATRLVTQNGTLLALVATTPREAWLIENNLPLDSTEESDPDSDTFSNLIERALGMNPNLPDANLPTTLISSEGTHTFTYRIARNQPDLTIVPQFTESLEQAWSEATPQLHDDTHPSHQTYRVTVPASATGFLRLKITR